MRLRIRASPKGGHPARLHPPPHSPQTRAPPAHPPGSPAASRLSGWSAGPLPRAPLLPGMPPQGRPPLGARKAGRAPPAALSVAGEVGGGRLERGGGQIRRRAELRGNVLLLGPLPSTCPNNSDPDANRTPLPMLARTGTHPCSHAHARPPSQQHPPGHTAAAAPCPAQPRAPLPPPRLHQPEWDP